MAELTTFIGIGAGICTAISQLPQLIKIIKEKKADDISYFMVTILLTGVSAWTWYGILQEDYPIIVTNAFSVVLDLLLLIFTIKYKNRR